MSKKHIQKRAAAIVLSAVMAVSVVIAAPELPAEAASVTSVPMFRLYNPNSGEHFYTASESERGNLESVGWKYEGIGWFAPESSDTPVYRLYNPNTGDHHFTTNSSERQDCINAGWKDEKIGWYSDDNKSVPLYREYNPNVTAGTHNYTTSKSEHDNLVSIGWKDEGIGWYGVTPPESKYKVGDTLVLGSYEQDNNLSNGAEPIEWQVVGTKDGHTLLLSKYALDFKRYNGEYADSTWETCTLRSWLNNDFYNTAFSASDKKMILTSHNANPDSYELFRPWSERLRRWNSSITYGGNGGNATDDKVFLLSWTEAGDYLDGKLRVTDYATKRGAKEDYNQKLLCSPTAYAKELRVSEGAKERVRIDETTGCCWWWLRSPGIAQETQALVDGDGAIIDPAMDFYYFFEFVRPAILID